MNDRVCISRRLLRLGFYGLILGAAAGAYTQLPDIRRYLNAKSM
jgi:hypothetical protein